MKRLILYACILSAVYSPANALPPKTVAPDEGQDAVVTMDRLIDATQAVLDREKELRALLVEFKATEGLAIKDPNNVDNLMKLVQLAKQVNDSIKQNHLQDYFAPQFIDELAKLTQVAEKKTILPPK